MKKVLSIALVTIMLLSGLAIFSGCGDNKGGNGNEKKDENKVEISAVHGKGTIKVNVPKKEDGSAKYEFTKTKPETAPKFANGTFFIETEKAIISFSTMGLAYNTSTQYKQKYGDVKATFQGYIDFMNDSSSTIPKADEILEINGKKAVKRASKQGGSGDYKYFGFYYMIEADEFYPGSYLNVGVFYKDGVERTSAEPMDEETQAIIDSITVVANN